MKKDLQEMVASGFNLVRVAAIGNVWYENDEVKTETDFIDALLDEADDVGIATQVRLQGYTMNLRAHKDCLMVGSRGEEMDATFWLDFIQNCLHHQGILEDNDAGTRALASHFKEYANLVSYQTYNEPHYPGGDIFDYHSQTIKAYRKWLVENNYKTEQTAKNYMPPKVRPQKGEDATEWILWRLFSIESLTNFLNHTAAVSKQVAPDKESMTCMTTSSIQSRNALYGESFFGVAEGMDTLGITHYLAPEGKSYFESCLDIDTAECAAAVVGKHCWLVEYDARIQISTSYFYKETYMAVGAGLI